MFGRVLIANRGEIACRIIRTCRRLGIRTVAVFSDADRDAQHVHLADEGRHIGDSPPGKSYLVIDAIIEAAKASGAEAIHPGYGFLAENAAFARACEEHGLVFIGPSPETIDLMGSKAAAKAAMADAGVPLVPGYHGEKQDGETLAAAAEETGFPLMIKAAAGGGGKGMRIVRAAGDFEKALDAARREASNAFGDDRVILERYIEQPRHIEVQVFGDRHGNRIHLFERDCSSQRRYQKVIEEAPAPNLSAEARSGLHQAAVAAADAVAYVNAGTVEFIVGADESYFFMEMNTRLQVEHPVTEAITGLDLVEWQLRVAAGERLPLAQDEVRTNGHAIEARIYAEDAERDFLPSTGRIHDLVFPDSVRVDAGVTEGDEVSVHYDPMIAKFIAHGSGRAAALAALNRALERTLVIGPKTNTGFLAALVNHPRFVEHRMHTAFLDACLDEVVTGEPPDAERIFAAAIVELLAEEDTALEEQAGGSDPYSPWGIVDGWRPGHLGRRMVSLQWREAHYRVSAYGYGGNYRLGLEDRRESVSGARLAGDRLSFRLGDRHLALTALRAGTVIQIGAAGRLDAFRAEDPFAPDLGSEGAADVIRAPMPGRIVKLKVAAHARVSEGDDTIIMEAMKMELTLPAPRDGTIKAIHAAEGEFVEADTLLIELETDNGG